MSSITSKYLSKRERRPFVSRTSIYAVKIFLADKVNRIIEKINVQLHTLFS